MKKLTFILLTFFSICIQAQPVLNASDFDENLSLEGFSASSVGVEPGSSGENQFWDFSSVIITPFITVNTIPIGNAPFASIFSNSNYCFEEIFLTNTAYEYLSLSTNSFEIIGVSGNSSISTNYSNPRTVFQFPFIYGTLFTDTYQSATSSFINSETRNYDAYGTIITPLGTFENVIRSKSINGQNITYNWYSTNPFSSVMTLNITTGNVYFYKNSNLKTNQNTKSSFTIYPNPTNGNLSIKNANSIDKEVVVTVYDVLGNAIIKNKELNSTIENIDLSDFSSGLYFVKITDKNNQLLYSEKIVKH